MWVFKGFWVLGLEIVAIQDLGEINPEKAVIREDPRGLFDDKAKNGKV